MEVKMPSLQVHGRVTDLTESEFLIEVGQLADLCSLAAEDCYTRHLAGWWCDLLYQRNEGETGDLVRQVQAQIVDGELRDAFKSLVGSVDGMAIADEKIREWLAQFAGISGVHRKRRARLERRLNEIQDKGIHWRDWAAMPGYQAQLAESEKAIIAILATKERVKKRVHQLLLLQEQGRVSASGQGMILESVFDRTDRREGLTVPPNETLNRGLGQQSAQEDSRAIATLMAAPGLLGWTEIVTEQDCASIERCHQAHLDGLWSDLHVLLVDVTWQRLVPALESRLEDRGLRDAFRDFREALRAMVDVDERVFEWLKALVALVPLRDYWDRARLRYRLNAIDAADPSARSSRIENPEYQKLLADSESTLTAARIARQSVRERLDTVQKNLEAEKSKA